MMYSKLKSGIWAIFKILDLTGLPYELGNISNLKLLDLFGNKYSEADLLKILLYEKTIYRTNFDIAWRNNFCLVKTYPAIDWVSGDLRHAFSF